MSTAKKKKRPCNFPETNTLSAKIKIFCILQNSFTVFDSKKIEKTHCIKMPEEEYQNIFAYYFSFSAKIMLHHVAAKCNHG